MMNNFPEFEYLRALIDYRLTNPAGQDVPAMPPVESWGLSTKHLVSGHVHEADALALLLIALAPHALPGLFDQAIREKLGESGDFPEIGGMRGKNFRGFLPTGQTAVFLLAGGEGWQRRQNIERLFWPDSEFVSKKMLWLEELPQNEPALSGKIIMAQDYVDLFLFGASAPPRFSMSFPAKKIETGLTSGDIVLTKDIVRHYKNLKDWIRYNGTLMDTWQMKRRLKKGFRVLFYGPSGTGKTLTAGVLGNETKKEVYKIDLSMVVSKYIGETEKNLELLFARAEDKDWILFFDEADAIFGKRTSVRDAHDKYANQEVSYLLERIEDYNGLVILATNMKNNMDEAFIRRFDDIVRFSVPTEEERREIWEKSFPPQADFGDIPDSVKRYQLTGGNIINVIHYAGIQAVKKRNNAGINEKLVFYIEDVEEGIRREMIKEGKPFA